MMDIASLPMRFALASRFVITTLLVVLAGSGCGVDSTGPTPIAVDQSYEIFSGPLDPQGTNTYTFTLNTTGTVQLMLAGATVNNPVRSLSPALRVEITQWNGSECNPLNPVVATETAPRLTASLHAYLTAGSYCAIISDPNGALTEPVAATMRVVSPALVRTGGDPGTAVFASTLTPSGMSTRTFDASVQGTVSVSLDSLSTPGVVVGLGLGPLAVDGTGCRITQIVHATAGVTPPIRLTADAGPYCAGVFDIGNVKKNETFSMTIVYP